MITVLNGNLACTYGMMNVPYRTGIWENILAQSVFWIRIRIHLALLDPDPGTHWACEIDEDFIIFTLFLIYTNFIQKMIET
jgi:hypothetical protein